MEKQLILGTAQFGMNYGITNAKGKVSKEESLEILDFANSCGIDTLDTAQDYGDAEELITYDSKIKDQFKINTKINFQKEEFYSNHPISSMEKKFDESLSRLDTRSINGLLIHNGYILNKDSYGLIKWLKTCKERKKIKIFGASLYEDSKIDEEIFKHLDFIQIPFSIFNQNCEKNYVLQLCKKYKVSIHVRSIFCQGLVLAKTQNLPDWLGENDRKIISAINSYLNDENLSMIDIACSFILSKKWINAITIGVTSKKELGEIYNAFNSKKISDFNFINELCLNLSEKIKDPRRW